MTRDVDQYKKKYMIRCKNMSKLTTLQKSKVFVIFYCLIY